MSFLVVLFISNYNGLILSYDWLYIYYNWNKFGTGKFYEYQSNSHWQNIKLKKKWLKTVL